MQWIVLVACLIASALADGGWDEPAFYQEINFDVTWSGVTSGAISESLIKSSVETVLALTSQDVNIVDYTFPTASVELRVATTWAEADALAPDSSFCSSFESDVVATPVVGFTAGSDCVSNLVISEEQVDTNLNVNCTNGDYTVTGTDVGTPVYMNYNASNVLVQDDHTILMLEFEVPSIYFYTNQSILEEQYDRSIAITFHDREDAEKLYGSCYTTRTNYAECPEINETWYHEDLDGNSCSQRLVGELSFYDLLHSGYLNDDFITVQARPNTRSVNGFITPTWELYMVAFVETWSGVLAVNEDQGAGDLDFHDPVAPELDWDNHLTINEERYSFYTIPFRISWPQQITIVAQSITSYARLVVLQALIEQQTIEINFDPSVTESFGLMTIVIITQTQFPFGLRNFTDPVAPAIIGIDGGQSESIEWVSSENLDTCYDEGVQYGEYCDQRWNILLTPQLCDISGDYYMEFWADCFNNTQCALDTWAWKADMDDKRASNSYSGRLEFSIEVQEFCPFILDEIETQGVIRKYISQNFSTPIDPGVNTFINDHVYFEVTFLTASMKTGLNNAPDFEAVDTDDSLIESVRAYDIKMNVAMTAVPFQTEVVSSFGDVTFNNVEETDYDVQLCQVDALTYPYWGNYVCDDTSCDAFSLALSTTDAAGLGAALSGDYCNKMVKEVFVELGADNTAKTSALAAISGDGDSLIAEICPELCDTCVDSCFDRANFGWNAADYLDFQHWTYSEPFDHIDANEIAFSLRLDERVMPVDIPNSESIITVTILAEIFYKGNRNPVRRELRRVLESGEILDVQEQAVSDTFGIGLAPGTYDYCNINSNLMYTGFQLDVYMDALAMPTEANSHDHILEFRYELVRWLDTAWTDIEIYQVDRCDEEKCFKVFPGRRNLGETQYVRYYIDIKITKKAISFQEDILKNQNNMYTEGPMKNKGLRNIKVDHCNTELNSIFNEFRGQQQGGDNDLVDAVQPDDSAPMLLTAVTMLFLILY